MNGRPENIVPFTPPEDRRVVDAMTEELLQCPVESICDMVGIVDTPGIYAIYYIGDYPAYEPLLKWNEGGAFAWPIYVGKACGPGEGCENSFVVGRRVTIRERMQAHCCDINAASNLDMADFYCRFLSMEDVLAIQGESLLIARFAPLWNLVVDGFEDCGASHRTHGMVKGRWDALHPGRQHAESLISREESVSRITLEVREYLERDPPATVLSIMDRLA